MRKGKEIINPDYDTPSARWMRTISKPDKSPVFDDIKPLQGLNKHNDDDIISLHDERTQLKHEFKQIRANTKVKSKKLVRKVRFSASRFKRLSAKTVKAYPKFSVLAVLLLVATATIIVYRPKLTKNNAGTQTLGVNIVRGAQREVFYPSQLPKRFSIVTSDQGSIATDKVSAYTLTDGKIVITASQQDYMPPEAFKKLFPDGSEEVQTTLGTGYLVLEGQNSRLAGLRLEDGRTIIFKANTTVDTSLLSLLLLSLES